MNTLIQTVITAVITAVITVSGAAALGNLLACHKSLCAYLLKFFVKRS